MKKIFWMITISISSFSVIMTEGKGGPKLSEESLSKISQEDPSDGETTKSSNPKRKKKIRKKRTHKITPKDVEMKSISPYALTLEQIDESIKEGIETPDLLSAQLNNSQVLLNIKKNNLAEGQEIPPVSEELSEFLKEYINKKFDDTNNTDTHTQMESEEDADKKNRIIEKVLQLAINRIQAGATSEQDLVAAFKNLKME